MHAFMHAKISHTLHNYSMTEHSLCMHDHVKKKEFVEIWCFLLGNRGGTSERRHKRRKRKPKADLHIRDAKTENNSSEQTTPELSEPLPLPECLLKGYCHYWSIEYLLSSTLHNKCNS